MIFSDSRRGLLLGPARFEHLGSALDIQGLRDGVGCDVTRVHTERIQVAVRREYRQSLRIGKESPQVRRRDVGDRCIDGGRLIAREQHLSTRNVVRALRKAILWLHLEQVRMLQIRRGEVHTETLIREVGKRVLQLMDIPRCTEKHLPCVHPIPRIEPPQPGQAVVAALSCGLIERIRHRSPRGCIVHTADDHPQVAVFQLHHLFDKVRSVDLNPLTPCRGIAEREEFGFATADFGFAKVLTEHIPHLDDIGIDEGENDSHLSGLAQKSR